MPAGLALVVLLAVPASALKTEFLPSVLAGGRPIEVVSGQAMVRFSTNSTASQRAAALSGTGASVDFEFPEYGWTVVDLAPGMGVAGGLAALRGLPAVERVEPNHAYRPILLPSDPLVPQQYGLSQTNAFAAWDYDTGERNITTVAVIDAGVIAIPELGAKMAGLAHAFCSPAPAACTAVGEPLLACKHGTQVASVAAAVGNNGDGMAGVAFGSRAKVLSVRVFTQASCTDDCGAEAGACATSDPAMANAIDYVRGFVGNALYGRIVINMSIGGPTNCAPGGLVQNAMNAAVAAGIPVIVAAGNDGAGINDPADCSGAGAPTGIIPVGATDSTNNIASFSSRGPELAANGLVAPGRGVITLDHNSSVAAVDGTSFSAPHVAGTAALIMSRTPGIAALAVQSALRAGADNVGISGLSLEPGLQPLGNTAGAGRLNAFRAMRSSLGQLVGFEGDQKAIAHPNPFRVASHGTVSFTIPIALQGTNAKIKIYTVTGALVKELDGLVWDGKNTEGNKVASGSYVFLVSTSVGETRGRFAVIR